MQYSNPGGVWQPSWARRWQHCLVMRVSACFGPVRSRSVTSVLTFCVLTCCSLVGGGHAETLDIILNSSARSDPIMEFILPKPGSGFKAAFVSDGFRVTATKKAEQASVAGFRTLINIDGDFEFRLDLAILRLKAPPEGLPRGARVKVIFGEESPPFIFGYSISSDEKTSYSLRATVDGEPFHKDFEAEFERGAWIVRREAGELFFEVEKSPDNRLTVFQLPCGDERLSSIQVFSNKHQGHTGCEIVYRNLRITSDGFFVYDQESESWFKPWMACALVGTLFAVVGLVWRVRQSD